MDAFDVVDDCSQGFENIGFAAAVATGEAVGVEFEAAVEVPFAEKVDLETCGEAAKGDIESEANEFHVRGLNTISLWRGLLTVRILLQFCPTETSDPPFGERSGHYAHRVANEISPEKSEPQN